MDTRIRSAAVLLAACVAPAFAQEAPAVLPPIQVIGFIADCTHPVLPTQRQVGKWTGLENFGQVYAARGRLMTGISRACRRPGVDRVQVALQVQTGSDVMRAVALVRGDR